MNKRRKPEEVPEPNIPVTPMLDMAFQLLAFFVMTYHPSDLEGQMQLALPSNTAKAPIVNPVSGNDRERTLEVPSDLAVIVKTQNDGVNNGSISTLTVEARSGPVTIRPSALDQKLTDALTQYLNKVKEAVENSSAIKLQADSRLKWDNVVQVMDACRKAGFESITFAPPLEGRALPMNKRRKPEEGPEPNIPVTPMLDMAFQLLAFFVMTYHPSDLEGQMQLALPSNSAKAAHEQQNVDTSAKNDKDPTLEVPADLTVIVKTQNDGVNNGAISALTVEDRSGPATIRPSGPDQKLTDALTQYLNKVKEAVENKSAIKLQADSRLKWDNVVQVMDACRKAGFENISFAPPPDFMLSSQ